MRNEIMFNVQKLKQIWNEFRLNCIFED